jgi:hypothetical protein
MTRCTHGFIPGLCYDAECSHAEFPVAEVSVGESFAQRRAMAETRLKMAKTAARVRLEWDEET